MSSVKKVVILDYGSGNLRSAASRSTTSARARACAWRAP